MDDVRIVGIHDPNADIAAERATEIGGGVPTFTDYKDKLARVNADFVLALGRHDAMEGIAHDLLENGIPFLMEKPMSYNARELRSLVDMAEATGGFAAVPLSFRYSPFVQHAKKLLDQKTYGPMTHFYARMNRPTSARYAGWGAGWMMDPKVANGGCLRNLGPHALDAFVYLTGEGEDIDVTGAQLSWSPFNQSVEDYASVLVKSRSGVLGTIEVGNGFPRDGTDGEWKLGLQGAILTFKDDILKLNTAEGESVLPSEVGGNMFSRALREAMGAAARANSLQSALRTATAPSASSTWRISPQVIPTERPRCSSAAPTLSSNCLDC